MNKHTHLLIGLVACIALPSVAAAKCYKEQGEFGVMKKERIGPLQYGMTQKTVQKVVGRAVKKGKRELAECCGYYVEWKFSDGLSLTFDADEKPYTIDRIQIESPSKLRTKRDIGIGSSRNDVNREYGCVHDGENSDRDNPDFFTAGSVYGGVGFAFVKGKVTEITVGAFAE